MDFLDTITDNGLPQNPFQQPGQSNAPSIPNFPLKPNDQVAVSTQAIQPIYSPDVLPNGYRFAHLAHIPMFPLYTPAEAAALYNKEQERQRIISSLAPEPKLKDKIIIHAMKATTGVNLDQNRKIENNLKKFRAAAKNLSLSQNRVCIITRWAVAPASTRVTWFVDVLEHRTVSGKWQGNVVHLKMSKPVKLRLLEKCVVKNLKPTKSWSKSWNFKPVEEIAVMESDGKEVQMEIVARQEKVLSAVEARQVLERFDFQWTIPFMQQ